MDTRAASIALVVAAFTNQACVSADLSAVPFRCEITDPTPCPQNYTCQSGYCVRNGVTVATRLATNLPDRETAFSAHSLSNGHVLICWQASTASRLPAIFGAVIDGSGTSVIAPGQIAVNPQAPAVVDGFVGDCALVGNRLSVLTEEIVDTRLGQLQLFSADPQNPDQSMTGATAQQSFAEAVTPFNGVEMPADPMNMMSPQPTAWYMYAQLAVPPDERTHIARTIVDQNLDFTATHTLAIEDFQLGTQINTTEFHPGVGGGWLSVIVRGGKTYNAWESLTSDPRYWILEPVSGYLAAYPLAVRNNELALAVNTSQSGDQNNWTIYWISPSDAMPDVGHTGSVVRPGPSFQLSRDVVRPGGYADHDRLVLATGQLAGAQNTVVISQVAWGTAENLQPLQTISKISSLSPRRLSLANAGGQFLVLWTEQVPETATGFTGYSALFVTGTTVAVPP